MKMPRFYIETMQQAIDAGLNGFAFQLMAESFADEPNKFGDASVILRSEAHNGQAVWFIMTKSMPAASDFKDE